MFIGERLLKLRKSLNLSQKEFGDKLGISQNHVSQIEKGTREPSEQLIKCLCYCFNLSEIWIKNEEGEMFIPPEEFLKNQMARYGERAINNAINNVLRETAPSYSVIGSQNELNLLFNKIVDQYGETAVIEAFQTFIKEHGLAVAAGRQAHRADTGDQELERLVSTLYDLWAAGDERLKTWASVQFDIAIPKHIVEEAQKKQQENTRQASAG